MSDTRQLLLESAARIFQDHTDKEALDANETGTFPEGLWAALRDNGLHLVALADSGVDLADTFALVKLSGRYALPLPLLEVILANRWLGASDEWLSVGVNDGARIVEIPWGRQCTRVASVPEAGELAVVDVGAADVEHSVNPAGEPRDSISGAGAKTVDATDEAWEFMALGRAVMIAGCLERVLELSVQYVNEREQFGRRLAKFQAIQHSLAVMAAEVAAASRAADAAVDTLATEDRRRFTLEVAVAKARTSEACAVVAEIAHQVHGAIGFTHEHQLHHFTRRLWAWRDEYGSEAYWQRRIGEHVARGGADSVWDFITTRA